jgi:tetratricopeptide (TPR) repeat protein
MIRLVGALSDLGRADDALRVGRRALTVTKTQEVLSNVRLVNGTALRSAGRYDEAIKAYQEVVDLHPRTLQAAQAQFEIGYVHEVYQQDAAKAREAYDRVKQHGGTSAYAEQAALRSKNLERLQLFSQELEASGDQAAAAAFKLAELKLFQLEKPEEALDLYAKVEADHATSPYAAKAAFARAWIMRQSLGDSAGAMTEYQRVVDLYPRSQAAAKSREILGLPAVHFEPDPVAVADSIAAADSARADSLAALPDSAFADSLAAAGGVGAPADSAAADTLVVEPGSIEHPELQGEAPSTHPSELTPAEVESIGRAQRDSVGLPIQVRER